MLIEPGMYALQCDMGEVCLEPRSHCVMTLHFYFLLLYILCVSLIILWMIKVEDEMSSLIHSLYINKPTNLEADLSMKNKLE